MALDPEEVVEEVAEDARRRALPEGPALLDRSAEPPPVLAPVRASEEVQALHGHWAQVHAAEQAGEGADGPAPASGVRAKVRARVATAAAELGGSRQQDDRALIGDLIRAVDALAARADELAGRLATLERVVPELVGTLGEDLVRLRAALEAAAPDPPAEDPPAEDPPAGDPGAGA